MNKLPEDNKFRNLILENEGDRDDIYYDVLNYVKENYILKSQTFVPFTFDSNQRYGNVESLKDLREICESLVNNRNTEFKTVKSVLEYTKQHKDGGQNFGMYREHSGIVTLWKYLENNELLKNFRKMSWDVDVNFE